jgi:hypothetical protein
MANGLKRTILQRRNVFGAQVAREIGVDHKTVAAARKSVGGFSPTEKRTAKDGKQYKASGHSQSAVDGRVSPCHPENPFLF